MFLKTCFALKTFFKNNLKFVCKFVFFHIFPHMTVWGSCFSLGSRRSPPASASPSPPHHHLAPLLITHHSSHTSHHHSSHTTCSTSHHTPLISHLSSHTTHLTHLITTHLTPLISHLSSHTAHLTHLITTLLTPLISQHSSQTTHLTHHASHTPHLTALISNHSSHTSQHHSSHTPHPLLGPRLPFVWEAQYTEPSERAAERVAAAWAAAFRVAGAVHRAFWRSCGARGRRLHGPRLPFVWQAQHTEPSGGAAGTRGRRLGCGCLYLPVAGAVHRASCRRGRRLGRGLSCAGAVHTEPPGGAAARVAAAWAAAAVCVAGAVHRAAARVAAAWAAAGFHLLSFRVVQNGSERFRTISANNPPMGRICGE